MHASILIISNNEIREKIKRQLYKNDVGEPNAFGAYASIKAWQCGLDYNSELRTYLKKNKDYLSSFSFDKKYSLKLIDGGSTYLLWYKVPPIFKDGDEFAKEFYNEEKIRVSPGSLYGIEGKNFIRVNIATSFNNITTLAAKLDSFLSKRFKK